MRMKVINICRSEDITALFTWLTKSQYLSHDIVNEIVKIMALYAPFFVKFYHNT